MKYLILIVLLSTGCTSIEIRVAYKHKNTPIEITLKPEINK